jgi:hypothetical protein
MNTTSLRDILCKYTPYQDLSETLITRANALMFNDILDTNYSDVYYDQDLLTLELNGYYYKPEFGTDNYT